MYRIALKEAKPGMLLAENVYTPAGQVIAKKGSTLSSPILLHISFYNIDEINVYETEEEKEADLLADSLPTPPAAPYETVANTTDEDKQDLQSEEYYYSSQAVSMSEYISNTVAFKEFKKGYNQNVQEIESSLNDVIKRQAPVESAKLVNNTKKLFTEQTTGIGMMNMLFNMRNIDSSTYTHSLNVSIIARVLGTWLGWSEADLDMLTLCGLLHDVGKSVIPNEILTKPGKLTDDEFRIMKKHPILGYQILENQDIDVKIKLAALEHHEKCDGSGYPFKKKREDLSSMSMIISIADVYDAMTADRCYRPGMCPFDVIKEFEKHSFAWYDAEYLLKFLNCIADSYVDAAVLLSDGSRGKIVMINKDKLTRPLILLDNGQAVDLSKKKDLSIDKIL